MNADRLAKVLSSPEFNGLPVLLSLDPEGSELSYICEVSLEDGDDFEHVDLFDGRVVVLWPH